MPSGIRAAFFCNCPLFSGAMIGAADKKVTDNPP